MSAKNPNLDLYASALPFRQVHPDYDTGLLPDWVRDDIDNVRVYGYKYHGIILPDGRKFHMDNKLNDLTGREWTFFINSVFSTHYPTSGKESYAHHIRKIHPTPKPPQLMRDLICFFTKKGELVFDSFMGVGGSLLGAALCDRAAAGIDLNGEYIEAYRRAAQELGLPVYPSLQGDCIEKLHDPDAIRDLTGGRDISLLLIDPPYANMMSKEKTGADIAKYGEVATPFTDDPRDLGNMDKAAFLAALQEAVEATLPYMKPRGHVVIFIKDLQPQKGALNMLHYDVASTINQIPGLCYKGMKIWADESAKLYPYGYPFSFVANQIHQYILVFRKEGRR